MIDLLHTLNLTLGGSSGGANWIWEKLAEWLSPAGATAIQTMVSILIYGLGAYIGFVQLVRIAHNASDWNHSNQIKKEAARDNVKAAALILVIDGVFIGVGFTMVFFFLGKFIGS